MQYLCAISITTEHLLDHRKSKRIPENIYFFFINYAKGFNSVDHNTLWKILKEIGIPDHPTCLLRNLHEVQEAKVEPYMEQLTASKLGKEYDKAVYCHHHVKCQAGWLTSWDQDCWEKYQQLQKTCRLYHSNSRKQRETKEPLTEGERGEWKSWLKTQHSGTSLVVQWLKTLCSQCKGPRLDPQSGN